MFGWLMYKRVEVPRGPAPSLGIMFGANFVGYLEVLSTIAKTVGVLTSEAYASGGVQWAYPHQSCFLTVGGVQSAISESQV